MRRLEGIVTAMTTPFDQNGKLMEDALRAQMEFLIARGVTGLYPCGTTGEMLRLDEATRKRVAEIVVEQAKGRLTVYIHVGAMTTAETVRLAQHASRIGADGIGVVTPAFFGLTDEEMIEFYVTVANSVPADFPVYMYSIPQCAVNDITPTVAKEVARRCPNVLGIKYSRADLMRTREYLEIGENFDVLQGCDRSPMPFLELGCAGIISGLSGAFPEVILDVWKAFKAGDLAAEKAAEKRMRKLFDAIPDDHNICYIKAALPWRGLPKSFVLPPFKDIQGEKLETYLSALEAVASEYKG